MKRIIQIAVLFTLVLCLISGLFAQIPISEDNLSKNFKIVHNEKNGKWGSDPQVSIELIKTIGDIEAEEEHYLFYIPGDIAKDKDGNIYVLDSGNHRIQKFDQNGGYLKTFGEEGQGPGEYMSPLSIDIDDSGYIYVSDQGNMRIQILNPDGTNNKTIRMEDGLGGFKLTGGGDMIMGGGGLSIARGGMVTISSETKVGNLVKRLDPDGNVEMEYVPEMQYNNFMMNMSGNRFNFTIDKDNNTFVSFVCQNRIEKYSPEGKQLLYIDRELNYDVTEPNSDESGMERSGNNFTIRAPKMNKVSNGIAVDSKGRMWVCTFDRQIRDEEGVNIQMSVTGSGGSTKLSQNVEGNTDLITTDMYKLEVFSPDGDLLGTIPLPHFCDQVRIFGDRLYILDKYRGMNYYEYKIVEN
ncbi:MAG: 6-bladed beta-propeller [bacterium]|nr:6-bladed beta-propeller [bacterium]